MMQAQGSNLYRHFVAATATRDGRFFLPISARNTVEIYIHNILVDLSKRAIHDRFSVLSQCFNSKQAMGQSKCCILAYFLKRNAIVFMVVL